MNLSILDIIHLVCSMDIYDSVDTQSSSCTHKKGTKI